MTAPNLIYVDDSLPGISRKGAGRGWAYYDPKGVLIRDRAEKRRLNAVALPPAYSGAWFCPAPNGHILATGIDAKGRKQYRYHPEFRTMREGEKFDGCLTFGNLLPLVRKRVDDDLRGIKLTEERATASIVRLLDLGVVRVGNEAYSRRNNSFGATTLRQRHADVTGNTLRLSYKAKSGKQREVEVTDTTLTRFVRKMQDLPGQNLFQYRDDEGTVQQVGSSQVNDYLFTAMGERFTAKNFRTWHASVLAYAALIRADETLTLKALLEQVAKRLGNTPAVTRKSYIHPAVIDLVERQDEWRATVKLPRSTQWLSREEPGLIELLEGSPDAAELLSAA